MNLTTELERLAEDAPTTLTLDGAAIRRDVQRSRVRAGTIGTALAVCAVVAAVALSPLARPGTDRGAPVAPTTSTPPVATSAPVVTAPPRPEQTGATLPVGTPVAPPTSEPPTTAPGTTDGTGGGEPSGWTARIQMAGTATAGEAVPLTVLLQGRDVEDVDGPGSFVLTWDAPGPVNGSGLGESGADACFVSIPDHTRRPGSGSQQVEERWTFPEPGTYTVTVRFTPCYPDDRGPQVATHTVTVTG